MGEYNMVAPTETTHGNAQRQESVAECMMRTLQESFSHLPKETIDDLTELLQMVPGATEEHHREIVATIVEILVPESLRVKIEKEYSLEHEDSAVRDRVNEYRAKVGMEIRRVRCERQMTQEALAEAAGLPQPHICKLEKGVHVPTHLTLEKIAKALGVPTSQIDPGCDP